MNQEQNKEQKMVPATQVSASIKNPRHPMTDEQRAEAKRIFLETMGKCWIVKMSCDAAGVSRSTYDYWRNTGYLTKVEMDEAYENWQDVLRGELVKVGIIGVQTPLIHNGRIALEPDGRKAFINKRDNRVLVDLASRYLPEWANYKDGQSINVTTTVNGSSSTTEYDDIPPIYRLVIDSRQLTPAQFDIIRGIAEDIEEKQRSVAATMIVGSDSTQ